MVGWHHQLNGREFEQTLRDGEGRGSLVCCSPWDLKELDRPGKNTGVDCHALLTIEYYSDMKKSGILPLTTTWMDLEDIMLSDINQTKKVKYCMFSLICRM